MEQRKENIMKENSLFLMDNEAGRYLVKKMALSWTLDGLPPGWSMQSFQERGMETQVFRAEPNAFFPAHSSPDEWKGLMLEGRMVLELCDFNGKIVETIVCEEGDALVFGTNVRHTWLNDGPKPARMLFIRNIVCHKTK